MQTALTVPLPLSHSQLEEPLGAAAYNDGEEDGPLREPYNISFVPPTMVTEDSVSQEEVTRGHLVADTHFDELAQRYVEMPTRTVLLSDLERNFNSHNQERALSLLQRKNLLKVDSRYLYAANDPKIYWKLSEVRTCCPPLCALCV